VVQLIFLGDIKHTVPVTSWQERRELPEVFTRLGNALDSIEIIPGNHDGNLNRMVPPKIRNINIHPNSGTVLHSTGLFHGHTWPTQDVLDNERVLMAHNHPNTLFVDRLGGRTSISCWIRGSLNRERIINRYPELDLNKVDPEIIIMPAFNDIGSGTPVNAPKPEFLGPVLKNGLVDLDEARVYLLDGTNLGRLEELREFDNNLTKE
jgi:metallophosphoesterase superfamily enzyme